MLESEHRIIVTEFETPCTEKARWKKRKINEKPRNLKELERKEVKESFVKELIDKIPIVNNHESIKLKSEKNSESSERFSSALNTRKKT